MASKLVISTVFIFDVIAFGLAVAAEQLRSKATLVRDSQNNYAFCAYESEIATGFGVGALLFLLASQIIVMAASKCFCCGPALLPSKSRSWALTLLLSSWVTFLIAESCLLAGSVRNAYVIRYGAMFDTDPPSCQTLRKGVFGAGAAFVVFTGILTELYYVSYAKSRDASPPPY